MNTNRDNAPTPNVATNAVRLPYNTNSGTTMQVMTGLHIQQQYQQTKQARIVSPAESPVPLQKTFAGNPNQPFNSSPANINQNTMARQQHQQPRQLQQPQLQLVTNSSNDDDTNSDVSSIPWGSIRPDPNYDPAKDPTSPEKIDEPFVAPTEITIRVVKGRRRKTMGSVYSNNTTVTPPYVSSDEGDKYAKWHQSPEFPTTQTAASSIPKLGLINSFASDASESNSFSGTVEQFASAEERLYLEEDLKALQEMQGDEEGQFGETKQRKGMVRREFNRRILRFKKKKEKGDKYDNSGEFEDENHDDASGNKIIINVNNKNSIPMPKKPNSLKKIDKFASQFSGRIKFSKTDSLRMVVGQENGC